MQRTREFRRDMRNRKIAHRKSICKHVYWDGCDWYRYDGQYSKGKIHCSCKMCTYSKTFDLPRLKDKIFDDIQNSYMMDMD